MQGISPLGRLALNAGECKNVCALRNIYVARAEICDCPMPPKPDPYRDIHMQEAIDLDGRR
ncbi:hypothetical protein HOD88_00410 [archaeon]|nr:hypothetical protein [archaeon]